MDQKLFAKLVSLPRLSLANRQTAPCKLCGRTSYFFDVVDFNKCCAAELYSFGAACIPVSYFRCYACGFLFTQFFDTWTPQEFAKFVYNEDYIKVDGEYAGARPMREATAMAQRLAGLSHLRILDYGSGSGLFADQLRSLGFDCVKSYDPFSSPNRPEGQFDVVTCFEVLEHTTSPQRTLSDIRSFLDPKGCVIFGTGIQPATIGEIRANWWYVAPRNGHVSIYTLNALAHLGQTLGLLLHAGPGGTAFAAACVSPASHQILASIGRPLRFYHLTAPSRGDVIPPEQKTSWHSAEGADDEFFRWTRDANIFWRLQEQSFESCELHIAITIHNEVQPGFADSCRIEVGNHSVPLARDAGVLTAHISIEERVEGILKLVTPSLLRPCDLRNVTDSRGLGLAVSTAPVAPVQAINLYERWGP